MAVLCHVEIRNKTSYCFDGLQALLSYMMYILMFMPCPGKCVLVCIWIISIFDVFYPTHYFKRTGQIVYGPQTHLTLKT